ncbi:MAG: PAS domain S-box protein [Pseudomonadota bacterium]
MLPDFVPSYSVGPLIGLCINGILALLCLVIVVVYRAYRPLKPLALFYVFLGVYFLGFTIYGYQRSPESIILGYKMMLAALCILPVLWIWFIIILRNLRPGFWAWAPLCLSLALMAAVLGVDHPAVLGLPLVFKPEVGIFHPSAWLFRPLIYTYDLVAVLATILVLAFRWFPGLGKPAYIWAVLAGLALWFLGGAHDAAYALHLPTLFPLPVMWLGSVWLSLCLALAVAFHLRDLERALRSEQARFSTAFALNPDGLAILDLAEGLFLEVNDAFVRLCGLPRWSILGRRPQALGLLPAASGWERMLAEVTATGLVENIEGRLAPTHRGPLTVLWSAGLISLQQRPCLLVVVRDISERKRAEDELARHRNHLQELVAERTGALSRANAELQRQIAERMRTEQALRQSQANLQTLFDSLQDFLFVFDRQGRLISVNPTVTRALGYARQELIGSPVLQLHPPDRQEEAQKVLEGILAGRGDRCQIPLMTRDGNLVPVETRIAGGRWGDEEAFFGISRDTSERQRAQEVLRQLAAGVAHNFNNLLAAILGNAQAAEDLLRPGAEPPLERLRQLLANVVHSTLAGRGVVQRLAAYVGGRQPGAAEVEACDLAEVVGAALRIAQAAWRPPAAPVEYVTDLEPGLTAGLPRDELMEVCLNLIRNALEAMPAGGCLTVTSQRQGDQARLVFADTGHGMDAVTAHRVFEPFFSTKGVSGQGLGLPSSRGLIQAYGGDIEVQSRVGRGAAFTVSLPLAGPSAAQAPPAPVPAPAPARPLRVLMVEDEALVAMGMRALLEQAGHLVRTAGRVSEAIAALGDFQPQVVVCDLGLPDGDGWEVARDLCRRPQQPVPFILLTGFNTDQARQTPPAGVPPAYRVLHKPVERSLLLATVAQAAA